MKYNKLVAPVLKWVGGKRQLLPEIRKYVPKKITTYCEPFVGGGAVLFDIQPEKAIINDINSELINLYEVIRDDVDLLINDLKKHKNEQDYFYKVREMDRDSDVYNNMTKIERASRIHYLNKTCYNGLFRVNQAGQFNSPFGRYKNPNIINEITLKAVSKYFNDANITFKCGDFEKSIKGIRKGSFVYFDPPYDPVSDSSNFTGYAKGGFGRSEQVRLKKLCDKLNNRGIKFLLSNSATDFIMDLYKDYNIEIIKAKRAINSNGKKRGEVDEVLVRNYE
ncbi:DNA adenine methylase [Paramaledivibacter caminithermalis]|jgi:DNA adenine methylase|uniref:Site-specific DNA-methyltransferase (adenine-specific) n=1 Tax=Paramaledivibacter caminithermalis (strain DSM 15212 / CIP 107654 / DViRD3) TaxID=1121301 RepID=A0A1M6NBI5_PARC5|nr:DNA adenine methylase [Paramaledivibacter caminithermalis]SHJ93034.1 DNA adenine methylase [Paramaledivibacter caminithermalis DSM 15212]